jgi:3'(2'), 5'-bisphosphate nucleotidase/myo-inositol-1(or 4)-monophosphatase
MKLSQQEITLLANDAILAAYQAGKMIEKYSTQAVSIQSKMGGDSLASQVLTKVDILCQEVIINALTPSCKKYQLALLSEETLDDKKRLEKDYFWCIDPLDGTLPFTEARSGYAVSIALVSRAGIPIIGVIYDPLQKRLYHAIKGRGAFRDKKPWIMDPSQQNNYLTHICDRSFLQQKDYQKIMDKLETIAHELGYLGIKSIQHGGAAMNACWVLENSPSCYFKFPKPQDGGGSLWDYAATSCLFNEIGAIASDIYGNPLELNRAESTFMNHKGIIYSTHKKL